MPTRSSRSSRRRTRARLSAMSSRAAAALQSGSPPVMRAHAQPATCRGSACHYPTPALAQDAGMTTEHFADFLYGACCIDWDAERERMSRIKELFDARRGGAHRRRRTDLRIGLAGREGRSTPAARTCRAARSSTARSRTRPRARSSSRSSRPSTRAARSTAIRLRFEGGRVVDASARRTRTSCSRRSTPTRARAGSASSASAATRASRAT